MTIKYRAAVDSVTGKMSILAHEVESLPFNKSAEFALAMFSNADKGFPLDTEKLAENIADVLLNFKPRHTLSSDGHAVFYTPTETGIILKTRAAGEQSGVAAPAVTMIISDKSSVADHARDMLARMNPDFMKKICDTIVPDPALAARLQQTGKSGPGFQP